MLYFSCIFHWDISVVLLSYCVITEFVGKWIRMSLMKRVSLRLYHTVLHLLRERAFKPLTGVLGYYCSYWAWSAGDWCVGKPRPSEFAAQSGSSISERWSVSAPLIHKNPIKHNKLHGITARAHRKEFSRTRLLISVHVWMEISLKTENGHLLCWGKQ